VLEGEPGDEPIYGRTYLPRKFKTVVAIPPDNDVDVFAHDLGFIAVTDGKGGLRGWNVTVGGGMGMTHGEPQTYPRLADIMAFCTTEQAVDVAEKVVLVQRDFGDRSDRKHARLKYTVEDHGLAWFRGEVEKRLGYALADPVPVRFERTGDRYGWRQDDKGNWHFTLFVENGRIADLPGRPMRTGLRKIAQAHKGEFRMTPNQHVIIANVPARQRKQVEALLEEHGLTNKDRTGLRLNAMACVALPTCGLALAESERYLPTLVDALEETLDEAGLRQDEITIRMTGCPNGCARPYLAEIGLVGRGPGTYNLYLGAAFDGMRLNKLYKQDVGHDGIVEALRPLLRRYAKEREAGERFGDFVIRRGVVQATRRGSDFHDAVTA
jgi:sulfite reductase (NADPH) hemoprotein beta-component